MKKSITLILFLAFFMLTTFTGCDLFVQKVEDLLAPPKLTEEQDAINKALKNSVGSNISLVYPKAGEERSPYIMMNIDDDVDLEAVVLYKENSESTSSVRINVLDKKDGVWVSTYDETSVNASAVDKINFATVDEKVYMIMGFTVSGVSEKNLVVYNYENNQLVQVFAGRCSDYEVFDLNDDGDLEIITIVNTMVVENKKETVARMYSIEKNEIKMLSEAYMDNTTTQYVSIFKSKVDKNQNALFIDAQKGTDTVATEILVAKGDKIKNLMYDENEGTMMFVQTRPVGISCMDINDDGIFDIPVAQAFPGYGTVENQQTLNLTKWYNYVDGEMNSICTTYTDFNLGYYLEFPDNWLNGDKITAKKDTAKNEIVFYLFNLDIQNTTEELLRIRVFTKNEFEEESQKSSYIYRDSSGQMIYCFNVTETYTDYDVKQKDIFSNFKLI